MSGQKSEKRRGLVRFRTAENVATIHRARRFTRRVIRLGETHDVRVAPWSQRVLDAVREDFGRDDFVVRVIPKNRGARMLRMRQRFRNALSPTRYRQPTRKQNRTVFAYANAIGAVGMHPKIIVLSDE